MNVDSEYPKPGLYSVEIQCRKDIPAGFIGGITLSVFGKDSSDALAYALDAAIKETLTFGPYTREIAEHKAILINQLCRQSNVKPIADLINE